MDIISAYRDVGSYRGAAAICATTPKTVRRVIERHDAGGVVPQRKPRSRNYESVAELVAGRVEKTKGRISAKRLLPDARAAGYEGSARNFRRLVAQAKADWRRDHHRGRRPAVWSPGEHLVIDWGVIAGLHVFCAVLAWSRVRFVRFAVDERAETTLNMLAECFETIGGVPKVVLADRMGCLKAAVVADLVVPTPDYVRFASHYRFRPDFCHGNDPESKGIVENLVGYAKADLIIGCDLVDLDTGDTGGPGRPDLAAANAAAQQWCAEVNAVTHSEIAAIPAERLAEHELDVLGGLPSLRPRITGPAVIRKVDRLSCVRFGSARYSVPTTAIGTRVEVRTHADRLTILSTATPGGRVGAVAGAGVVLAEHRLVGPGEASVIDAHYGGPRPTTPVRAARPKTADEKTFCALGPAAQAFLTGAVAAGSARLGTELGELLALGQAHGEQALLDALARATAFRRWRAEDVRSILAAGAAAPRPQPAGQALVVELPAVPTRSLTDYAVFTDTATPAGGVVEGDAS
ncbi:transposase [Pseudonocardia parietis]|uniref:Transposase n=2 Tax=Pseudonocardia parietis TaxID=570936 RepID=A0ABS4W7B7_9PSEU|nr:transposase [Pseudonocardia parietis]MBP2366448.1 transposase [Pseudonocardia parietis]MBP2370988.1 transposase [Pseudonocardia parietis]MBP2372081.1 transposase [Pseudonocardia parietis]